jgi:hypothetical protein
MKAFKILLVATFFVNILSAQTNSNITISDGRVYNLGRELEGNKAEIIDGSAYFNDRYLPTQVSGYENDSPMMRYNAAKDEMEFVRSEKMYNVLKTDSLEIRFVGINKVYKYLPYELKNESNKGYLLVLTKNKKVNLYAKERITLVPKKDASNSYDTGRPAFYRPEKDSYLIGFENKIVTFPKKKKELVAMFPSFESQIDTFIKSNNISFSEKADLLKLVNFIEKL